METAIRDSRLVPTMEGPARVARFQARAQYEAHKAAIDGRLALDR
jgi:hypothetical protein